jgi:RNA polymerase sigma factor (sigma-70 family)
VTGSARGTNGSMILNPRLIPTSRLARVTILRTQSDDRLAELVGHGSAAAFEAIVHRYRRSLLGHCARILGDADAEEAVQDALLNAHAALQSGSEVRSLGAWLHAVAHNAAVGMLRRRAARPECPRQECADGLHELSTEPGRGQPQDLVRAVQSLPPRQRDAIVMRELEGRTYEEIAVRLEASDGAVRQLLNRARRSVRESLASLIPAGPLLRWALTADDCCGVGRVIALSGASAIATKLTGAAVLSAVSVLMLVPAPHEPEHSWRGSPPPGRRGVSAIEPAIGSGSPSKAAPWRLAAPTDARDNLALRAASVARQPLGGMARPAQPGGSGRQSGLRIRGAGDRPSAGGSSAAGMGAPGRQPREILTGFSAAGTGATGAGGQRSGGGTSAGGPAGVYQGGRASPSQQRAVQSPLSVGQTAPQAG